ncbi:hypothetical protein TetV_247 [Tetraselmis virus 1]|uniref:Uncharacterized protein n=1 Tax=Tetraselmis virus 1 TaxID=2060617 RepID=A0A2P0VNL4_9VIRU|nr:hypothetical protein QJ968_gp247 [Tetraselmis virus 1]AUF82339.1 hypothetical protein TetV_247 [Tetraselmis virus 1]
MFNRLKYDKCAAKSDLRDNVSIFSHTVDVNRFARDDTCRNVVGLTPTNGASTIGPYPNTHNHYKAWGDMVNLENDLRGQTREDSLCPSYKYIPNANVISNKTKYKKEQKPIDTTQKSNLPDCQMIDYDNLRNAYKK